MNKKPRRICLKSASGGYNKLQPGDPEYCEAATKLPRNSKGRRHRYGWDRNNGQKWVGTCKLCGHVVKSTHCTRCESKLKKGERGPECDWCNAGCPSEIDAQGALRLITVVTARAARDLVVSLGKARRGYNYAAAMYLVDHFEMPLSWVLEKAKDFKEGGGYGYGYIGLAKDTRVSV